MFRIEAVLDLWHFLQARFKNIKWILNGLNQMARMTWICILRVQLGSLFKSCVALICLWTIIEMSLKSHKLYKICVTDYLFFFSITRNKDMASICHLHLFNHIWEFFYSFRVKKKKYWKRQICYVGWKKTCSFWIIINMNFFKLWKHRPEPGNFFYLSF